MIPIPKSAKSYNRTAEFNQVTVPPGLLRDHQTKAGVWGKIHVVSGAVRYTIPGINQAIVLKPERPGIVELEVAHHVEPVEDASFYMEFWR
jgi:tellurite methyltransferase